MALCVIDGNSLIDKKDIRHVIRLCRYKLYNNEVPVWIFLSPEKEEYVKNQEKIQKIVREEDVLLVEDRIESGIYLRKRYTKGEQAIAFCSLDNVLINSVSEAFPKAWFFLPVEVKSLAGVLRKKGHERVEVLRFLSIQEGKLARVLKLDPELFLKIKSDGKSAFDDEKLMSMMDGEEVSEEELIRKLYQSYGLLPDEAKSELVKAVLRKVLYAYQDTEGNIYYRLREKEAETTS